ncbi:MAG: MBL fold metallo-hydrolase [Candidatus Xenobia bacterium]
MQIGNIEAHVLSAGTFRLDGGAMYGPVPRLLWEKYSPADAQNRIEMALHCTLIKTPQARVLVDTGISPHVSDDEVERWSLQRPVSLAAQLQAVGVAPDDITHVVLTHLHFDHVGGTAGASGAVAFPRAEYVIQQREWDAAHSSHPRARASYPPDTLHPLENGARLALIDGELEISPGLRVIPTGGHSWGHQVVAASNRDGGVLCWGDLMPLVPYARPLWICGYDVDPEGSVSQKQLLAERAFRRGWHVVTSHDPHLPIGRLARQRDQWKVVAI